MFVSRKKYELAVQDAIAAHDRLDIALAEIERLTRLLEFAVKRRTKKPEVIPSTDTKSMASVEEPPEVIMKAIKSTFPGDQVIYSANMTYAFTQKHRWEDEAEVVASEIIQGRS